MGGGHNPNTNPTTPPYFVSLFKIDQLYGSLTHFGF